MKDRYSAIEPGSTEKKRHKNDNSESATRFNDFELEDNLSNGERKQRKIVY